MIKSKPGIAIVAHFLLSFYSLTIAQETRIAVIGCHQQGQPAPVLPYMAGKMKPDYCVWVGDNVYADTETDPRHIQRQLEIMEEKTGFKELREQSEFMVTWDDHDLTLNNAPLITIY